MDTRIADGERRRLLKGSAAGVMGGVAAGVAPFAAVASEDDGPFGLGIASGTPASDRVMLWTRLVAPLPTGRAGASDLTADELAAPFEGADVELRWRVTLDEAMRIPVASGRVLARAAEGHVARVEVRGLSADRWYWYRFEGAGGRSRIGRTRTLPAPRAVASRLRVAVASCQNYEQGWYGGWRHVVADEPDLIVHVGDYIYEKSWGSHLVRPLGLAEARSLDDYRRRYAIYRRDPDLQAAHAAAPWFVVWDDHECSNDYAGWTPERLDDAPTFGERRRAAYQAWFEHMPVPAVLAPVDGAMTIYRVETIGDLASLYLLDTRQYRTPQACPRPGTAGASMIDPGQCAALDDPQRTLLGAVQETWLARAFAASRTRWNLIAQQTLIAPLAIPRADGAPRIRTDGWDGYPGARARLLDALAATGVANPVFVGGDLHAFHVADLRADSRDDRPVVATEFVGTSITSQSPPQAYYDGLVAANRGHLRYANGTQRGYLRLELRRDRLEVDLMGLDDVRRPDTGISRQAGWVVERGRPGAVRVA